MTTLNDAYNQTSQWDWDDDDSGWNSVYGSADAGPYTEGKSPDVVLPSGGSYSGSYTGKSLSNFGISTNLNPIGGIQQTGKASSGLKTGGAATGSSKPYATVTTQSKVLPAGAQWPTFAGPVYDEREVRKRAQRLAAPGLSQINMKMQQAMSRYYENPNVRRMVLRDTLAGYGVGVAQIMGQAQTGAQAEYSADYGRQYSEAMNAYNMAMSKLSTQMTSVQTTTSYETPQSYEKGIQDIPKTGVAGTTGTGASGGGGKSLVSRATDMYGRTSIYS